MKNVFVHTGSAGDILFSLYFVKEFHEVVGVTLDEFFIQTNVETAYSFKHPNGNVGMTTKSAEFTKPLIEYTKLFKEVCIGDQFPCLENIINLSNFRKLPINFAAGNIASWYYQLIPNHLPQDYSQPIVIIKEEDIDYRFSNKILITKTNRYNNVFLHWKAIEKYKDSLVFVGLENEYENFCKEEFEVEYCKVNDMLELAKLFAGCKGFIGSQSGNYSLAEIMKIPRIVCLPEYMAMNERIVSGPVNNQPCGGWFELASTDQKFISAIENLMNLGK